MSKPIHWADFAAERIIRRHPDKEPYTLAAGITPSGPVHFGNFREVITVDLVARALQERGRKVRFIFSWDDYDTFRKVPPGVPRREELEQYLHQPIVDVPDPWGESRSWAAHFEQEFERQLLRVGISAEFLYQADKYRSAHYGQRICQALEQKEAIAAILNARRSQPLPGDWLPVSVYCEACNTDHQTKQKNWDGQALGYYCAHCGHQGREIPAESSRLKLPWRIDWPMRWAHEGVDFEPGGKDHSSEGGSFSTAKEIVALFGGQAPDYLQYDFVGIKGAAGKMSSSAGEVITLEDVLGVYEPPMVRWIFASHKPNVDFNISFDTDVFKTYEDYERQGRLARGEEGGNPKKVAMARRVFELIRLGEESRRGRVSFRHLTNMLQIHGADASKACAILGDPALEDSALRAAHWLKHHAPAEFKFALNDTSAPLELDRRQRHFLEELREHLSAPEEQTDKELHQSLYDLMRQADLPPAEGFALLYRLLISKDKGPKLANLILVAGRERIVGLLGQALVREAG